MPQPLDPDLPEPIRELWASLSADVTWLHGRWIIYRQLFGTNKERVELLNETAGTVTSILQHLLLHDIQISISKVGDPAGSGAKKNLTVRRLQLELRAAGETAVADAMEPVLAGFDLSCKAIRHRRNKWLAHSDLETRLNERATPLLGPSRDEIEKALQALRSVMNTVELHFKGQETAYEHFVMQQDGEHLISALCRAKRYRELVAEGTVSRSDLRERFPGGV